MTAFCEGVSLRPPSNGEVRDIQHSMSMLLETRFPILIYYDTFYKIRHILLQNATTTLLQNAAEVFTKCARFFITKCDSFKMWQLLQVATIFTVITK